MENTRRKGVCGPSGRVLRSACGNQIRVGRSGVAKERLWLVAVLVSGFAAPGSTAAHAADPAFCREYTRAALNQVRGGLADPHCAGRLQGARWSTDFAVHYEWCLGVSPAAAGEERDARTQYLRGCNRR
jgi:hypothetical protein